MSPLSGESNSWNVSQATPCGNSPDGTRGRPNYFKIPSRTKTFKAIIVECIYSANTWISISTMSEVTGTYAVSHGAGGGLKTLI